LYRIVHRLPDRAFLAVYASLIINNLRAINGCSGFDSHPRLQRIPFP
jgi:hypothetical protein